VALLKSWTSRLRQRFSEPRALIIHGHMFKNAGTSFDWSLSRSFGTAFVDHRDDEGMKTGAAYLQSWLRDNPQCLALSSHWITPPLPRSADLKLHLCLLFRDPIERTRSVYNFERAQQGVETPGAIRAKQMDFRQYMQWQMQPMPGPAVKNYQTRYCSGEYLGEDLEAMYARARELILNSGTLGLVHRYDESMVLFEHRLRPFFPDLDLSYLKQNVLSKDDVEVSQRRRDVLAELGDVAEQVLAANAYDLRLFEFAEQRFAELIAEIPDMAARLDALKQRNLERAESVLA
jgi:hypothetical protein